jgi:hypothetical protein
MGYNAGSGLQIGGGSRGCRIAGLWQNAVVTIGINSSASEQLLGCSAGTNTIGSGCVGSLQRGLMSGSSFIGSAVHGATQLGVVQIGGSATNLAWGALQMFNLGEGQHALTISNAVGSILLGAGTASNRYAIVAGDGQQSHGEASITAGGGFYIGNGGGITTNAAGFVCNTNFSPSVSNAYDLGTSLIPWRDIYIGSNSLYMAGTKALSISNGNLVIGAPVKNAPTNYITGFTMVGAGGYITTGSKGYFRVPNTGVISKWVLRSDVATTTTIGLESGRPDAFPVTASIVASAPLTLSGQTCVTNTTLTGWTKAVTAGDYLKYDVTANSAATYMAVELTIDTP